MSRKKPTEREKRFHLWLIDTYPCACGCGQQATLVHHPLQEHPEQRTRRNHEFVVPMHWTCHDKLHKRDGADQFAEKAWQFRALGYEEGVL